MRKLLYFLVAVLVLSCTEQTPEKAAAEAARGYYEHLKSDFAEGFLEGKAGVDSFPADYCEQMLEVYRQYVSEVNEKHGGIHEVRISPQVALRDSSMNLTYAFLLICFGDSTQEEITVPMVEQNGKWLMK